MHPFPGQLAALTSLRFLLALGVVLFHYQLQWTLPTLEHTGLIERARLGVDVFFMLSGFVLAHAYREDLAHGTLNYRQFVIARVARIYPAHLAMLAFVIVMVAGASVVGADFDGGLYNLPGFFTTLLLVHAWDTEAILAEWNGPSWSLSAEWFVYLTFPLFAWLAGVFRARPIQLIALAAVVFVAMELLYQFMLGTTVVRAEANLGVLRIIPEFIFGMALYRLGHRFNPRPLFAISAAVAMSAGFMAMMHLRADDRLIVLAAGPLVLALALLSKTGSDRWVARKWMLAAGEASFAVYLVHFPFLIAWKGLRSALQDTTSNYLLQAWEVAALLALTVAGGVGLHYLIERPARRWIRRSSALAHAARGPGQVESKGPAPEPEQVGLGRN